MTRPKGKSAASRRQAELAAAMLVPPEPPAELPDDQATMPPQDPAQAMPAAAPARSTRVDWLRWRVRPPAADPAGAEHLNSNEQDNNELHSNESASVKPDEATADERLLNDPLTQEDEPAQEASDLPDAPLRSAEALWQARAIRYGFIYLLLACAVLTLRYTTQNTYPTLRDLRAQVSELQTQRDTLDLQVQQLTTGPRVLDWARSHGMVPYAQARKQSQDFTPLGAPPTPMPVTPLEMDTQWK